MSQQHYLKHHAFQDLEALIQGTLDILKQVKAEYDTLKQDCSVLKGNCDSTAGKIKDIDTLIEEKPTEKSPKVCEDRARLCETLVNQMAQLKLAKDKFERCEQYMTAKNSLLNDLLFFKCHMDVAHR